MLCGSLKSNGLADPFKNNEDATFAEEQLPPPLQEHATASMDHPARKGRQSEKLAAVGLAHAALPAFYQQQHAAQMQQPSASQQVQFPPYFDMWPAHAAAISQALGANMGFGANGMGLGGMQNLHQNGGTAAAGTSAAAAAAFGANMSAYQTSGLPLPQTVPAGVNAKAAPVSDAITNPSLHPHTSPELRDGTGEPAAAPMPPVSASQKTTLASEAQPPLVLPASSVLPYASTAAGAAATTHPPMQYPTPPGSLPPLLHPSLAPPASQTTAAAPISGFPGSFPFPPNTSAADAFGPAMHSVADMTRLTQSQLGWYAQHLAPFSGTAHPAALNGFLPTPFALNTNPVCPKADNPAVASAAAGVPGVSAAAGEPAKKRKTSGAVQRKGSKAGGVNADAGGPVIARRAANRPPPQVQSHN